MRRIVKSLAAALGVFALGSCSGGGSVLSFSDSSTPDHVIITVQGGSNIARVLPGAGLPLSATSVRGTQNGFLSNNQYRWDARLVAAGSTSYPFNTLGQTKPCGGVNVTTAGVTSSYVADFSIYIAIDPVNEGNIEFIPPTIIPVPAGSTSVTPVYPYCVIVDATPIKSNPPPQPPTVIGPPGSIVVVVANPQNPLQ